jgi:RNA polymerase sigma-70 factor (ECF subfamily)
MKKIERPGDGDILRPVAKGPRRWEAPAWSHRKESDGAGGPDEGELVGRILSGDGDAFATLVGLYGDRLLRLVFGILGDWHLSEDVFQDVFFLVHRKLHRFDRRSSLLTWLYRISINSALKARRRARRQAHLPLLDEFDRPVPGAGTERGVEMREIAAKLLRCLPAKLRVVVLLREWEGLKYEEIARVLGCSRGAVEQRLHRAMVELRRVWIPAVREDWFDGL